MNLTDNSFWDNYWKNLKIPAGIDLNFSFERCLAKSFSEILSVNPNLSLFEIGCAPGKWLTYFHKKFGYNVVGIDNSDVGCQKTRENFEKQGIRGKIYQADFLEFTPPEKYDIVLSLGVIEHFENQYLAVEQHLKWLKPNGKLIIGMPNFRGANYLIQKKIDKNLLKRHNLKIMSRQFYCNLARKFDLVCLFVKYVGGFEPALFVNLQKKHFVLRIIIKLVHFLRRYRCFDGFNTPFFSSYLLGAFVRNRIG